MILPHGGKLINRVATGRIREELCKKAKSLPKLVIPHRFSSDCEMIAIGAFSPLEGFMDRKTVETVLKNMRLTSGILWAIPIVLPVPKDVAKKIKNKKKIALYEEKKLIAIMELKEVFTLNLDYYCKQVFKTSSPSHPGVEMTKKYGNIFLAGDIVLINNSKREHITSKYFLSPKQLREVIRKKKWNTVVAFQTRNPIHRAHEYLIKCALESHDGVVIHPIVGQTKSDDIPARVRMRCYEVLIDKYFNKDKVILSALPMAMRYADPREAIHHMIVRKNYGCTHMIIGRDHAGVGNYYGHYEAQELADKFENELEIKPIKFEHAFYCKVCKGMATRKTCPHSSDKHIYLSGAKVREMLRKGESLPEEFTRREVFNILKRWISSKSKRNGSNING